MWSRCQKLFRAQQQLRFNWTWKVSIIYSWLVKTLHNVLAAFSTWLWKTCKLWRISHVVLPVLHYQEAPFLSVLHDLLGIRYPRVSVHVTHKFLCRDVSTNWHSWAWQTRMYVHMQVHCENRSLIQSHTLMRLPIKIFTNVQYNATVIKDKVQRQKAAWHALVQNTKQ